MKSKVYFADFRTTMQENLFAKLRRLMKRAGFERIDFAGKYTAVKIHFGEPGNIAFLRPNWARTVADYVKELGGRPFLTDANTLYAGGRNNALSHLESADINGFTPLTTGCHGIIADGLKGTDEVEVPLTGTVHCRSAKIGRAVMDADVIVTLTHVKGHELMGLGGVIKNVGMGCGSRAGKFEMHSEGKPVIDASLCVNCGMCRRVCGQDALQPKNGRMTIDRAKCAGCGRCISACHRGAMTCEWGEQSTRFLDEKTAEYALAVLKDRPAFHVAFIRDVSPNCDCCPGNDAAIIPDVGMLAGTDPVAIDAACGDLCRQAPRIAGTKLDGVAKRHDPFDGMHGTHWRWAIEHGERIGLGSADYELVKI